MSAQPKPTGEWTVEWLMEQLGRSDCYTFLTDAHNAALDEAVDAAEQEILLLRQQLAAEREDNKRLKQQYELVAIDCSNTRQREQQLREQLAAEREKVTLATQMVQIESKRANEAEQKRKAVSK